LVSNPWREAIEGIEIMPGALVKAVSNPWREAIEGYGRAFCCYPKNVSNPWREAIEEFLKESERLREKSFQSLEGGY